MAKNLRLEEMTLADAVEPLPATLTADAHLGKALGTMKKSGLHEVAVVGPRGELLGVLSDETLLKRRRLSLDTLVGNLLVVPPRLTVDDPLSRGAEALLSSGFRQVPVLQSDGRALAGQLTRWRLLEILKTDREICALPAHAVMTPDPVVVRTSDTLDFALDQLRKLDEPTIPVVDGDGRLAGVVSGRDILRLYAGWAAPPRIPKGSPLREKKGAMTVKGVMTSPVVDAPRSALVGDLIDRMILTRASSVVISEKDTPDGIVTKGDLIDMIASLAPRKGVFLQVTGLEGHDPFVLEDVFASVEPAILKLASHVRPMTFNVHVMEHHRDYGHRAEVRARLQTDMGLFTATAEDDDLMAAVAGVLERLEKQVLREKDRKRPSPRKARSGEPRRGPSKLT